MLRTVIARANAKIQYSSACSATRTIREPGAIPTRPPRLFDRVREAARVRHYSRRTETAYLSWIRRFIFFHGKRHPAEMGAPEVTKFLSSLAGEGNVAASTQNQALGALLFLYRDVLIRRHRATLDLCFVCHATQTSRILVGPARTCDATVASYRDRHRLR